MPPSYIRVHAIVWAYGRGRTDRHTDARNKHSAEDNDYRSADWEQCANCTWWLLEVWSQLQPQDDKKETDILYMCHVHTFNTNTTATDCTLVPAHTCNIHTVSLQAHITVFTQAVPYKHKASTILSTSRNVTTFPSHKQCDDISSTIVNKLWSDFQQLRTSKSHQNNHNTVVFPSRNI